MQFLTLTHRGCVVYIWLNTLYLHCWSGFTVYWTHGEKVSEIWFKIQDFQFKKMHLNMSFSKWQPYRFILSVFMFPNESKQNWVIWRRNLRRKHIASHHSQFQITGPVDSPHKWKAMQIFCVFLDDNLNMLSNKDWIWFFFKCREGSRDENTEIWTGSQKLNSNF